MNNGVRTRVNKTFKTQYNRKHKIDSDIPVIYEYKRLQYRAKKIMHLFAAYHLLIITEASV